MIISRTPFRISFFGGGTDYPTWVAKHGGAVLGTSINHYSYLTCRYLPPFFEHKYRIAYSKTEHTQTIAEIEHPVIRAVADYLDFHDYGLEIHHDADLPARSGIASSSACVVGVLSALIALKQGNLSHQELAKLAIYIEQEVLNEAVGFQDSILTCYGGFNRVNFHTDGEFSVAPVETSPARISFLQKHCMLFFTQFSRFSFEIAQSQIDNLSKNEAMLHRMRTMVDEGLEILENESRDIVEFGELLHEGWLCKRSLSNRVSTEIIDQFYQKAREAGAIGGKLLGAGGGGFMLRFVEPKYQEDVKRALPSCIHIPFEFEQQGSHILFREHSEPFVYSS